MHIIIISLIIILFSPVAIAGEKSITIVCSNDVAAGSILLTNPPKINCDDFSKAQTVIGLGITVGSGLNSERLLSRISQSLPMGKINGNSINRNKKSKRSFSMKELCERGAFINCQPYYERQYRRYGSRRYGSPGIRTRQKWFDDSKPYDSYHRSRIDITGHDNESGRGDWMPTTGDEDESGEWKAITGDDNETRQYRRRSAQGRKRFQ